MYMLCGAVHVRAQLQLGAELVTHSTEQGVMANLHKMVGTLHGGINQAIFIQRNGILPVFLHQLAGPHISRLCIKILYHGGVLRQMAHRISPRLFCVGYIDDQFFFLDHVAGQGNDILEALQRFFNGVHPCQIHSLFQLAVGKLKLIIRLGNAVHKKLVKIAASQCADDTVCIFLIERINLCFLCALACHALPLHSANCQLFFFSCSM